MCDIRMIKKNQSFNLAIMTDRGVEHSEKGNSE